MIMVVVTVTVVLLPKIIISIHGLAWLVARSIWARTLPERARKRRAESPGAQCPTINFSPSDSPPPFLVSPNNIGSMSVRKSLGVPLFLPEWLRF